MSDGCEKGCLEDEKQVKYCIPNLVSPAEIKAGKRDCRGKKPFNVPWCPKQKGWEAGSMVHTKCGHFFNVVRAYGDPSDADSEWIEFDFKFLFKKLLETMSCDEKCEVLSDKVKPWKEGKVGTNVAMKGETWCFREVLADGSIKHTYACAAKDDVIKDRFEEPTSWTEPKTNEELMCWLLSYKPSSVRDNMNGTVSWVDGNGKTLITWDKTDTDTHMGDFVPKTNKDGSTTFTSKLLDHKGHAVKGAETQSFTLPEGKFAEITQDPDGTGAINIYEATNVDGSKVRWKTNEGLPVGIQQVGAAVYGEFVLYPFTSFNTNILNPTDSRYGLPLAPVTKKFTVADYPLLAVKGLKLQIGVSSTASIRVKHSDNGNSAFPKRDKQQWGQGIKIDGNLVAKTDDYSFLSRFGDSHSFTDHLAFEYESTGTDFEVEVFSVLIIAKAYEDDWTATDFVGVDMFSSVISFVAV